MAKPLSEVSLLRGERVKELLKAHNMTQEKLARLLGIETNNLNAKLNGRRTLTERDADAIAKIFEPVKKGWILGDDKYPTLGAELLGVVNQAQNEAQLLEIGFGAFASLIGYSVTSPSLPSDGTRDIKSILNAIKSGFVISKDGKSVLLSMADMNRLQNKICDHIEIELNYLLKEKGVDNGKH